MLRVWSVVPEMGTRHRFSVEFLVFLCLTVSHSDRFLSFHPAAGPWLSLNGHPAYLPDRFPAPSTRTQP